MFITHVQPFHVLQYRPKSVFTPTSASGVAELGRGGGGGRKIQRRRRGREESIVERRQGEDGVAEGRGLEARGVCVCVCVCSCE